ncbi:HalOD1 output domain-containing protein [Haloprofundus salilacus]|uniref:HalOD1 output domain-containing protein n=1 Tax=Haloprofundus salilacus TaxID=2876190 RepID=UPI001CCBD3E1|nr:HalOD1 output domain-containing protein [Haloprofundus salilacus]
MKDHSPSHTGHSYDTDRYRQRHEAIVDPGETDLSFAVIDAIAAVEGVDPLDLDPFMHESINPDALNSLFAGTEETGLGGSVAFEALSYTVVVESHGRITVYEQKDGGGRRALAAGMR